MIKHEDLLYKKLRRLRIAEAGFLFEVVYGNLVPSNPVSKFLRNGSGNEQDWITLLFILGLIDKFDEPTSVWHRISEAEGFERARRIMERVDWIYVSAEGVLPPKLEEDLGGKAVAEWLIEHQGTRRSRVQLLASFYRRALAFERKPYGRKF